MALKLECTHCRASFPSVEEADGHECDSEFLTANPAARYYVIRDEE